MTLPYIEPLTQREPSAPVIPEPPRRGERDGEPCLTCTRDDGDAIWADEHWVLRHGVETSLPGAVWLATRVHVDSFADLPPARAAEFGVLAGRIERAILGLGNIGRVHLYRWGDGGAHFHVWFLPRPLGMVEAKGMMLPLWEDVLPNASDDDVAKASTLIGKALSAAS